MSSAADGRCDRQGCGGDLLVMKRNDESPLPKKRKRSRKARPPPSPSSPTNPFPSLSGRTCFRFPHPRASRCWIIPIQAHTEHCKLISLGYSHGKSGCQILFPPQFLNFLSPPQARGLALGPSVEVASSNFAISLHLIKCAPSLPAGGEGRLWSRSRPLDSFLWPLLCFLPTIRASRLDAVSVLTRQSDLG